jgi:hypothetical protein
MTRGSRYQSAALISCVLIAVACGGSAPPAESANSAPVIPDKTEVAPPTEDTPKTDDDTPKKTPKEEVAEPTFTADMSVEDAIKAIPQSAERMNVDQETLSKPLQEESLYAPCKPGTSHFKFRIAVWRGKAVAIDMTTTPKNPKLAECLKGRIREITWPAKVPSLNTVEYSM